jgi:hypothetical protein
MSASSHFAIPVSMPSLGARRPRTEPAAAAARSRTSTDWEELDAARRRASLLALLAIYAAGLGLVVMLYQGEDIGVVLSAFFAHAIYMAGRGLAAALRSRRIAMGRGTLVIHARARWVPALAGASSRAR